MHKLNQLVTLLLIASVSVHAQSEQNHAKHGMSEHSKVALLPKEAGNDAFGTIQEIIKILQRDNQLDWRTVNLEALRAHLIEMQDMTLNVEVIAQTPINNGFVTLIKPTTERARTSMQKVFVVHPKMLVQENGYSMTVITKNNHFKVTVTVETTDRQAIAKLQGLGYIGVMALGDHHQAHHLAIAKGLSPHR